jgi:hypothetical protein
LWHQTTSVEFSASDNDLLYFKFLTDPVVGSNPSITHYPLNTYCARRQSQNDGWVILIGDVPKQDLKLVTALNANSLADPFGTNVVNIPSNGGRFKPVQWFGFGVYKSEDEAYKINYKATFVKLVNESTGSKGDAEGTPVTMPKWDVNSAIGDKDFPVNTNYNKINYYKLKTKDPYKKQKFTVIHINEFDLDELRTEFCNTIFGVTPETDYLKHKSEVVDKPTDAIITSALPDETESKDVGPLGSEEQPVSATAAEIDKEKKKVATKEKEVKAEKEKLKKMNQQPTSATAGEDYQKKMDEASTTGE